MHYSCYHKRILVLLLSLSVLFHEAVIAADAQSVEAAQRESQRIIQQEQQRQQLEFERANPRPKAPAASEESQPDDESSQKQTQCFNVNKLVIDGITLWSPERLNKFVQPYIGQCISTTQINQILKDITNQYVEEGYSTTRAYLPEQDLSSGDLHILVLEGVINEIKLDGSNVNLDTAFPNKAGKPFNLRDFEQGIDQIRRLSSNASVTMDIVPSERPGYSDVVIKNQAGKRWHLGLATDNTGVESTGYYQSSINLGLDNLLRLNDFVNLTARANPDINQDEKMSKTYAGLLTLPYGPWTLTLNGSRFEYASIIQTNIARFQSSGNSEIYMGRLDHVVMRDQTKKWTLAGSLTSKVNHNYLNDTLIETSSRKLSMLDIDSNFGWRIGSGVFTFDFGYTRGLSLWNALEDERDLPNEAPRAQFDKYKYGASLYWPFMLGSREFSLQSSLVGQYAKDVLYGTEQILIGGPFSVRGFRKGSISGDTGFFVRNELSTSYSLQSWFGDAFPFGVFRPFLALDYGHINNKFDADGGELSGISAGVNLTVGKFSLQTSYSQSASSPSRFDDGDHYGYVRVAFDL